MNSTKSTVARINNIIRCIIHRNDTILIRKGTAILQGDTGGFVTIALCTMISPIVGVNDGHSPEQTQIPELSVHVDARTALAVQPRIVKRAKRLGFIV